jgi:hypothetical protein
LALTTPHLLFLSVGRGTSLADLHGDETDVYDEAPVDDHANINENVLVTHLMRNKNSDNSITLLTEARYTDVIWNMAQKAEDERPIPPEVRSLLAERRFQTITKRLDEDMRVEKGSFVHAITEVSRADSKAIPRSLGQHATELTETRSLIAYF